MRSAIPGPPSAGCQNPGRKVSPGAKGVRRVSDGAVEVREVVVRYGATTAVDGVSLTVPRGRVLALLGHNGAGKTSLLQVCEGFRRADGGGVRVLGLDPVRDHDALMPRIGIMLQSGGVYPWATAGEILRLFASFSANPINPEMLVERLGLAQDREDPLPAAVRRRAAASVARGGAGRAARAGLPRRAHGRHGHRGPAHHLAADRGAAHRRRVGAAHHAPAGRGGTSRRRRRDHAVGRGRGHRRAGRADRRGGHRPAGGTRGRGPAAGTGPPQGHRDVAG